MYRSTNDDPIARPLAVHMLMGGYNHELGKHELSFVENTGSCSTRNFIALGTLSNSVKDRLHKLWESIEDSKSLCSIAKEYATSAVSILVDDPLFQNGEDYLVECCIVSDSGTNLATLSTALDPMTFKEKLWINYDNSKQLRL